MLYNPAGNFLNPGLPQESEDAPTRSTTPEQNRARKSGRGCSDKAGESFRSLAAGKREQRGQIKPSSRHDVGAGPAEQAAGSRSGCARGAAPGGGPICRGCFRSDGAVPAARRGSLGEAGCIRGIFYFLFIFFLNPDPLSQPLSGQISAIFTPSN